MPRSHVEKKKWISLWGYGFSSVQEEEGGPWSIWPGRLAYSANSRPEEECIYKTADNI